MEQEETKTTAATGVEMPPEAERVNHMPLIIQFEGEEPIYESK